MKELSATEVARSFSAVLDGAEKGETVVVTRGGRQVAMIVPSPRGNGAAVKEFVRSWQDRHVFDDEFEANVAAARGAASGTDDDPWQE
ncbi:type II toxin-antitoxin system Phd/YefM family antitoxin [Pseudonocardia sp. RS11V-5]|uniref:type II toxin-antitoxin system Phd/YefM family antitoxin n=1 Tax=Pseudonocardia terrae TaxID=2905831 RepID=UPI001E624930|nr:type II toxin-antitoxin system Phd/YefM family antitoxin [Pseudonocardia terrae]MCE3551427.1 type II toxin-antitoxin system Phd/YefM family antitoxin [Pseudonocardia terrae]